ncbi:hypothetical protein RND81_04G175300 [Saponaria officinalis]|uniref:DUF3730 domain-containing protein n=1 Tax=Saponaria officinalis TaxID=3572 RepID=A0AAW1LLX1_SAPOF
MDAYTPLLERTKLPQPPLQRFAVIQLFDKLRSAPPHLNPNSEPGRDAIAKCLNHRSPAVVDQAVRELCRLVKESIFDISSAVVELHSALEASPRRLVGVFVRGIGFLVRFGFGNRSLRSVGIDDVENHPFVKVVACRPEVQNELLQQVLLLVVNAEKRRFGEVCNYIRPLLTYSMLRVCSSGSSLKPFLSLLVSSLMSVWCSSHHDMYILFDMLIGCLRCFPFGGAEDLRNVVIFAEILVDAHRVQLRWMVKMGLMVREAQLAGVKLLDALLTLCLDFESLSIGTKPILQLSRRLLSDHKELGLCPVPELFQPMLSLLVILVHLELEDEKLFILDFLGFILKWEVQETSVTRDTLNLCGLHLYFFPVISLISSPSKSVKQAASQFLFLLESVLANNVTPLRYNISNQDESMLVSKPETIISRLLQHLWLQDLPCSSSYLNIFLASRHNNVLENGSTSWIYQLKDYALQNTKSKKSSVSVSSAELISPEMPWLLGAVVASLVMHPSLEISALDMLASLGVMEPKLGTTLLLSVLYHSNFLRDALKPRPDVWLKLLGVLPSLASHSAMQPLIIQTLLPMLHKDSDRVLYATALRLLCRAWEMNDKVFTTLHVFLLPEHFTEFGSDRNIVISIAASLRDICKQNPDRGIELILSVAACIESRDAIVQALGLQSLGFLCEADVIDFYTAWNVIANHVKEYMAEPVVAYSLCTLLRWGAVDAEAYAEASRPVLQILWNIGIRSCSPMDLLWKKSQICAFEAINCFEVSQLENSVPDLKVKSMELLVNETDVDILRVIEELETKIIAYEHSTRRRLITEKKAPRSKIEKLLDVFPRVIFSSGRCNTQDLPGAALFCLPLNITDVNSRGKFRSADDVFGEYRDTVKEVSTSLDLSRNTLLAHLSLQSWKSLMKRWLKDYNSVLVKASSTVIDKTSKAANDILKEMIHLAEDSIPRVAENISLAIGAFCLILPPSTHAVKVTASKFLLSWLSHHEHEHRQWSAAIAVGAISSCLHATDRQLKLKCISELIEVLCASRSSFVKGACGIGLGYSCQDLLTRGVSDENASDKGSSTLQEKALLGTVIRVLSLAIHQVSQISSDHLESLLEYKPSDLDYDSTGINFELKLNSCDDVEGDIWGVAGLVLGLGLSVTALFRAGSYDTICNIKLMCISWVAQVSSIISESNFCCQSISLATGACLVLPAIVSFCRRVDLMDDDELDTILLSYENLISKLVMAKTSNVYQNLLTASCVGGGALLASILGEGLFPLDVKRVIDLLELFRSIYSGTYPDLVHLGAFLGVVNIMGADSGSVYFHRSSTIIPQTLYQKEESSDIKAPVLSSSSFVENLSSSMQDMFVVARQSDSSQLQAYAAWAITFLGDHLWSKESHGNYGRIDDNAANSKTFDQSFSKDATVVKLTSWLMQLDYLKLHANTVAAVLRCLSSAPRLPKHDWGQIVRRCIKYESHVASGLPRDSSSDKRRLIEECLRFSLAHASEFDSLLVLLDDFTCLSRFRTLNFVMQSCLLFHLPDLLRIFSSSRSQKLLEDMCEFLSSSIYSYQQLNTRQKWFLQLSFWKALNKCVNEASADTSEYLHGLEMCMEVLFRLLPASPRATSVKEQMPCLLWQESMACLGNARQAWLMRLLQHSAVDEVQRDEEFGADLKKMLSLAKLVKIGSIPLTELAKLKSLMMCRKTQDTWDVLIEVVAALQTTEGTRSQWLIDILEISCITKFPSTALHFIGLLSGSSCKYMPLLILDPRAVLLDLPVTLSALLSSPKMQAVADKAVSYLWTATKRIYDWATSVACNDDHLRLQPVDPSETENRNLLVNVMLDSCCRLKGFLSVENQLQLANMVISRDMYASLCTSKMMEV